MRLAQLATASRQPQLHSIQFADEPMAAYREIRRVLVPGGRVALPCWEPRDRSP